MTTALVPLASAPERDHEVASAPHARADFVAHLVATSAQAPQTRARRRAAPEEAVAAYHAFDRRSADLGRTLSRSL